MKRNRFVCAARGVDLDNTRGNLYWGNRHHHQLIILTEKGSPQGKLEFGETYPTPQKWCAAPKKIAEEGDICSRACWSDERML